jgi:inosose dehydratase
VELGRHLPLRRGREVSGVLVANAPVSYGAFEITVGIDPNVPEAIEVMDAVANAGYAGIDLGPLGYLGTGETLAERLSTRGLRLAGGYLEIPFSHPSEMDLAIGSLDELLDVFDAAGNGDGLGPRPTLADAGSPERSARPGQAVRDRSLGLDDVGWRHLAEGVGRAVERCRDRGYMPTFHHHTASYVEAPWEIEELLTRTDVGLCIDTGHLLVGGGDPLAALGAFRDRINHIHLKDARADVIRGIVESAAPVEEIWRRGAFCPLGEGDVQVEEALALIRGSDFEGWLVVEQDQIPNPGLPPGLPAEQQKANRVYLRERGW